jgi:hypothetical protein
LGRKITEKARGCGEYNSILYRESHTALVFHFAVNHEPYIRDTSPSIECKAAPIIAAEGIVGTYSIGVAWD